MADRARDPTVEGIHVPFSTLEGRIGSAILQGSNGLTINVVLDVEACFYPAQPPTTPPADLPVSTSRTTLSIEVGRFFCFDLSHHRWNLRRAAVRSPRPRRTRRLAETQGRISLACGGAPGPRLLKHLRLPASRATVLRSVRAIQMPDALALVHVSVDDRAMKRDCGYGTILVDLDRHRVVDLFPDRTAATLAGWLWQRTDTRVVARDRSTKYARSASIGASQAVQIAGRWRLLANMRQAVERWLHGAHARLRRLPSVA